MPDPHPSAIILPPTTSPTISQLLSSLKRTTLTIHNRLTSIQHDATFISSVKEAYGRPLVANERCGSWYIPPERKEASAYFKSTDGHERAWKFSTRRLNLHLVDLIEKNDGIIVVDSTRRGKRMPDALSTTLPIWCTILNLALLPSHPLSSKLHLPPWLPPSTHSQIIALVPTFLSSLQALNLDLPKNLTKPLRPLWVTPDSPLPDDGAETIFEEYRPVICCTASRRVVGSEMDEGGYIQGAGDDTENWAHGLTPAVFWTHIEDLLATPEDELPDLINRLVEEHKPEQKEDTPYRELTPYLFVCPLPLPADSTATNECCIALTPEATPKESWIKSKTYMQVGLGKSKTASRNLRLALPDICTFAESFLSSQAGDDKHGRIVLACESGRDLSVGTALALSCYLFNEKGEFRVPDQTVSFNKTSIRSKLGPIMTVYPDANPTRNTLQSVNSFLMDWQR